MEAQESDSLTSDDLPNFPCDGLSRILCVTLSCLHNAAHVHSMAICMLKEVEIDDGKCLKQQDRAEFFTDTPIGTTTFEGKCGQCGEEIRLRGVEQIVTRTIDGSPVCEECWRKADA